MDSFLYRMTLQPLIKGGIASGISFAVTGLLYYLFITAFGFIEGDGDFILQAIIVTVTAGITCFFAIYLKHDHWATDTMSHNVGDFWVRHAMPGKKIRFIFVELMMITHIILAVVLAVYVYTESPIVFEEYKMLFANGDITVKDAMLLFVKTFFTFFIAAIFAVTFFLQYRNVRDFAIDGRCHHCHAAFSLSYVRSGGVHTSSHSEISREERQVPVAERYEVTTEDGVEVDRRKIETIYDTEYDYYRTDTTTTEYRKICRCGVCGLINEKSDFSSVSTTTQID